MASSSAMVVGVAGLSGLVYDEEQFCSLARKVPEANRTGDLLADNTADQSRLLFQVIIDSLTKRPELVQAMHRNLMQLMNSGSSAATETVWASVSALGNLDETRVGELICSVSGLKPADIARMWSAVSKSAFKILAYGLQLPLSAALPDGMKVKSVCRRVLVRRLDGVGHRLKGVDGCFVGADGHFNWSRGCYKIEFKYDQVTSVEHVSGKRVPVKEHVVITKQFVVENNDDDQRAIVVFEGSRYECQAFFAAGEGSHSYKSLGAKSTILKDLVNQLANVKVHQG